MRHFDETFWWDILKETLWWDILMRHFDEAFWWGILTRHFDETFWRDILTRHFDEIFWRDILTRHFDETFWRDIFMKHFAFWWDILMRHFDETFWWNILIILLMRHLMRHFDEKFWWLIFMIHFDGWKLDLNMSRLVIQLLKGLRSWISSGSIVDENSVPTILTKNLDSQSVSFLMKLNKHWSDSQKHCPFHFWNWSP